MRSTHRLPNPIFWAVTTLVGLSLAACGDFISVDDYQGGGTGAPELSAAPKTLTHAGLSIVMSRYTIDDAGQALFDYDGLSEDPESRLLLDQYLSMAAAVDPGALETPAERFSFIVNVYNAAVVKGVLANYKQDRSFKVTDSSLFFSGPNTTIGKVVLSLDQIENLIGRGDFQHASAAGLSAETEATLRSWHTSLWPDGKIDARLHAAFNCGAISCPNLLTEPPFVYTAATLEAQLGDNIKKWLDSEKGAGADGISRLFDWYKVDFEAAAGSVSAFIERYRTAGAQNVKLDTYLEYDWTLNIAPSS